MNFCGKHQLFDQKTYRFFATRRTMLAFASNFLAKTKISS